MASTQEVLDLLREQGDAVEKFKAFHKGEIDRLEKEIDDLVKRGRPGPGAGFRCRGRPQPGNGEKQSRGTGQGRPGKDRRCDAYGAAGLEDPQLRPRRRTAKCDDHPLGRCLHGLPVHRHP